MHINRKFKDINLYFRLFKRFSFGYISFYHKKKIVILVFYLFQILSKFGKKIKYYITILYKLYRKKIIFPVIKIIFLIINKDKKLYTKFYYFRYNIIITNYVLFYALKK